MRHIKPCLVEGCIDPAGVPGSARGYCKKHYLKWYRHGSPDALKASPGEGTIRKGYRMITVDGRQIREHRYVMEQMLGRPLAEHEHIHHIDRNKLNNDPSNLQVVSAVQHMKAHGTFRNATHKECARCHVIKPRSEFSLACKRDLDMPTRDNHNAHCRDCRRESDRAHSHERWLRQKASRRAL